MKKYKIIFLNQMTTQLFLGLAEDLTRYCGKSALYSSDRLCNVTEEKLELIKAAAYARGSILKGAITWVVYLLGAIKFVACNDKNALLFFSSNPPIAGIVGLLMKKIRKQNYVVLMYDMYPDILLELKKLKSGIVSGLWYRYNRLFYENASCVIAIGRDMQQLLQSRLKCEVRYIPCWAETANIYPIDRGQNWFRTQHVPPDKKIVIIYSGNMGFSHDLTPILKSAESVKDVEGIFFLLIGDGIQKNSIEQKIIEKKLTNIKCLPFQNEDQLSYSLSAGDIGIVSYAKGTEGLMVPSKAYAYLSAGLALFVFSEKQNELTKMIDEQSCGFYGRSEMELVDKIKELLLDENKLCQMKRNARAAAVEKYSRNNTTLYNTIVKPLVNRC